ncbi:MAG: 2'-5' RNA ligase family protein [Nocardioides sp.]|uniref:2'-5' RNA ligase family protein n=1 Tax=Nocardioides sp. TaxID=35761 RepID=UPI0039E3AA19
MEEAEQVVAEFRHQLDPVAHLGMPAHVTVLFPFAPAGGINDDVVDRLRSLFGTVPAFENSFVRTEWFGEEVLWLASEADETLRSLTSLVAEAFPESPPYGGEFDDVVPHLTVADHGPVNAMRAAERSLRSHLPINAFTSVVTLMAEQPSGRWEAAGSFVLGG